MATDFDFDYTPGNQRITPVGVYPTPKNPGFDAFQRQRVSTPATLFDSKQLFDNQPLFWDDAETSGGGTGSTYNANQASTTIDVSATTAGTRVRQTFQRFNYQPGKSQLILMTGVFGAGAAGITRRMGLFDANNGLYFELAGTTLSVVRRSYVTGSAVNTVVNQDDWNIDKLDGTGPSKYTLDTSKTNIYVIDFEWLGVGAVRFGVVIDGKIIACHQMVHANTTLTTVYMSTPNLPLRYEISNDGTGAASDLVHICSSVVSEGGSQANGILGTITTGGTHVEANTADTLYAIVGIRLKAANVGARIDLTDVNLLTETATPFEWQLLLNPTVAGSFTYTNVTNYSVQEAAGDSTTTVTGGIKLVAGFVSSSIQSRGGTQASLANARRLGAKIDGTVDEIVLCARPLSANADIQGAINFREW